jgi:hypothetical protein
MLDQEVYGFGTLCSVFSLMKMCSVASSGICWAVDSKNNVFRRAGAKKNNPIGKVHVVTANVLNVF